MIFLVLALVIGNSGLIGKPQIKPSATIPTPPNVVQSNKMLDPQVLEAVLVYILSDTSKSAYIDHDKTLLIDPIPDMYSMTQEQVYEPFTSSFREFKKELNKLNKSERKKSHEAVKHMINRLGAKDGFEIFTPKDKRITFAQKANPSEGKSEEEKTKEIVDQMLHRPILANPPGYSLDRQFAVVHLIVPWSIHSADATYFLANRNGKWVILARGYIYSA